MKLFTSLILAAIATFGHSASTLISKRDFDVRMATPDTSYENNIFVGISPGMRSHFVFDVSSLTGNLESVKFEFELSNEFSSVSDLGLTKFSWNSWTTDWETGRGMETWNNNVDKYTFQSIDHTISLEGKKLTVTLAANSVQSLQELIMEGKTQIAFNLYTQPYSEEDVFVYSSESSFSPKMIASIAAPEPGKALLLCFGIIASQIRRRR